MATLMQLRAEPWWDREVITPELDWLGDELCARTGRPRVAAGSKGDVAHLNGGHRSQEWLLNSRWCTSRSYTVQRGLTSTQLRHIGAFDFTPGAWGTAANRALVREQTIRLVAAGKAGRLPGVVEVLGTLDGRTPVGVDVPEGQVWSTDISHLDHWHLTFDRRHLTDRAVMERIIAVALGEDDTMTEADALKGVHALWRQASDRSTPTGRQMSDYVRVVTAGTTPTRDVWVTLVGYDGAVPVPVNWANRENTHLAVATALTELLSRAVAGEGLPKAVTELTELVKAGGGSPDVAALGARVDQLTTAVTGLQAAVAALQAAVLDLVERDQRQAAALARAYADGADA